MGAESAASQGRRTLRATLSSCGIRHKYASCVRMGVFDFRVRPAAGAVALLRPWVGDGAKSAILVCWASRTRKSSTVFIRAPRKGGVTHLSRTGSPPPHQYPTASVLPLQQVILGESSLRTWTDLDPLLLALSGPSVNDDVTSIVITRNNHVTRAL